MVLGIASDGSTSQIGGETEGGAGTESSSGGALIAAEVLRRLVALWGCEYKKLQCVDVSCRRRNKITAL